MSMYVWEQSQLNFIPSPFIFLLKCTSTLIEARTCSPDEYACKNGEGQCVPLAWMCDQSKDCSDGSDEHNCSKDNLSINSNF